MLWSVLIFRSIRFASLSVSPSLAFCSRKKASFYKSLILRLTALLICNTLYVLPCTSTLHGAPCLMPSSASLSPCASIFLSSIYIHFIKKGQAGRKPTCPDEKEVICPQLVREGYSVQEHKCSELGRINELGGGCALHEEHAILPCH